MSDGLKTGLIIGGAAVVGLLIWKNSQTAAAALAPTTSSTAPAPGAPAPTAVVGAVTVGSSTSQPLGTSSASSGGGSNVGRDIKAVAYVAAAPVIIPTQLAIKGATAVGSGVVSAGKAVGSAASTVGHAIASIF